MKSINFPQCNAMQCVGNNDQVEVIIYRSDEEIVSVDVVTDEDLPALVGVKQTYCVSLWVALESRVQGLPQMVMAVLEEKPCPVMVTV